MKKNVYEVNGIGAKEIRARYKEEYDLTPEEYLKIQEEKKKKSNKEEA